MTVPQALTGLSEVADRYDVLLCDVWGVIHNGAWSFPEAIAALQRFQAERGPVILISNSPRPSAAVEPQLESLRVPRGAWTRFITSGDATRVLLRERSPGPAWRIGPERDDVLYEGLGLEFAGPAEAAFVACSGPVDDDVETPEDYRAPLTLAAARGLPMVCANPDIVVQRGDRLIYCGGALAAFYERLGGATIMAGKPHAPIYALALDLADRALGAPHDPARTLAIGDGIATDIAGAQGRGLDRLFIATGVHGGEAGGSGGPPSAAAIDDLLAASGLSAQFAMGDLAW
jgi:HAD superfamily hydrolase (TIGR01459 family)